MAAPPEAEGRIPEARRQGDVDYDGAAGAVILGRLPHGFPRQPGGVVHLGDDLDVVASGWRRRRLVAEVVRNLAQILRTLFTAGARLRGDGRGVALAQAGDQDEVGVGWDLEEAGDPWRRNEGRHRDAHDGYVVGERRRHLAEGAAEGRLGELPRDEQRPPGLARGGSPAAHRGSPERTNLLGVPSSAPPAAGRHSTTSSILRASSKSLSVTPPAAWFFSFTITRPQVTARSG